MIQSAAYDQEPVTKAEFNLAMGFVKGRFSDIGLQFQKVDERFEQIDRRFEQVDRRFEQVDRRFDALTEEVHDVRAYAGILHEDMMHQFKLVLECLDPTRAQLEDHERRIQGIERDLPILKDAVSGRR